MEFQRGHAVVKIYTPKFAIVGKILVTEREYQRGRLSDYLNRPELVFIPVHDAHIFSLKTKKALQTNTFILLNKRQVDWIIPVREPGQAFRESGESEFVLT